MLDVHPPHHASSTWRDFFIHIITIVLGLLIAIGLEQSVEALHRHEQVQHAREALHAEREKNLRLFALETQNLEHYTPMFATNLAVFRYLREHPGAPSSTWPGDVRWNASEIPFVTAAWSTVQRDGVIEHLSQEEVEQYDDLYQRLDLVRAAELNERALVDRAGQLYESTDELLHASPGDVDKIIAATNDVLLAHARIGMELLMLNKRFPAFNPVPAFAPLEQMLGMKRSPIPDPISQQIGRDFSAISGHNEASTEH